MRRRYTGPMPVRQSLPLLWLLSDARNDAQLDRALARLPHGSGFVFRHYHLNGDEREKRFRELAKIARSGGHWVVLAGEAGLARQWGADGIYGNSSASPRADGVVWLATAHDAAQLAAAAATRADGVFLSPVFATRSHPGTQPLGIDGFHALARQSPIPVIALGGMTHERARELDWPRWGAIDGLVPAQIA